jgi:NAD(P)-dependent dehydrogenase (short-subunit alcohol dehydrogenase family)
MAHSFLVSSPEQGSAVSAVVCVLQLTGGDSGIGRAVAVHFAREGADVAIVHLEDEQKDAEETAALVEKEGRKCLKFAGDVGNPQVCILYKAAKAQHCAVTLIKQA